MRQVGCSRKKHDKRTDRGKSELNVNYLSFHGNARKAVLSEESLYKALSYERIPSIEEMECVANLLCL
jgi:hypothetical protein